MRKPDAHPENQWALWVGLLGVALFLLAALSGHEDRGFAAVVFMASIGIALAAHWKSRRHVLFWLAAVVLVVVHTALVLLLPWPTWKMSSSQFMPFAFLDFFANFAVIRWTQMAIKRREGETSATLASGVDQT